MTIVVLVHLSQVFCVLIWHKAGTRLFSKLRPKPSYLARVRFELRVGFGPFG